MNSRIESCIAREFIITGDKVFLGECMYRILLVDDEKNVLNALKRELEPYYTIEAFSQPEEALQRCRETNFDLVMADYQMPNINGLQFLKEFGKLQPDAARIILSGHADTSVLLDAINETHIYRFIDKPWDTEQLASILAQALIYSDVLLKNKQLKRFQKVLEDLLPKTFTTEKRYQVLVVDDEPNILNAITRDLTTRSTFQDLLLTLLKESNPDFPDNNTDIRFDVNTTTSPMQALDYAKRVECDVVIVDYLMPEMNGLEFLKAFREIQPDVARIILSGHADRNILIDAINNFEIFSFISKPWREYDLKNAVTQSIVYKSMLQENRLLAQKFSKFNN
jgi:two-component system, probable response regulator PhcQ